MNTETVNSVMDRIGSAVDALAESLKVPAEQLLDAGMRYVVSLAVVDLAIGLVFLGAGIALTRLYLKKLVVHRNAVGAGEEGRLRYGSEHVMTEGWIFFYVATGIGVLVIDISALINAYNGLRSIPLLFAPEIGVLKLIGDLF